jgi:hypothetical protein
LTPLYKPPSDNKSQAKEHRLAFGFSPDPINNFYENPAVDIAYFLLLPAAPGTGGKMEN